MSDQTPLNPVQVEEHIRELVNRIARGIQVCSKRYAEFLDADRAFDREYAQAYLAAEGSIKDRERKLGLKRCQRVKSVTLQTRLISTRIAYLRHLILSFVHSSLWALRYDKCTRTQEGVNHERVCS